MRRAAAVRKIPQLADRSKELPQRPAAHVLLDGLPALQFVEQVLPKLAAAGVQVRLEGEVREYRKTNSPPTVQVAAVERANSADWFDLHIKVAIDGEEVPSRIFRRAYPWPGPFCLETGVISP